jgi:putative toxin-antitoxin system antitoxin component (TIGR02293 family)
MTKVADILDKKLSYDSVDDRDIIFLMEAVRRGIKYAFFVNIAKGCPFSLNEWSNFLHLSERSMQRYKKEKRTFDSLQSEKILQIAILYRMGIDVFGNEEKFNSWLLTDNLALGKIKPKELLDNTFGISMLHDELIRIEHGVLV